MDKYTGAISDEEYSAVTEKLKSEKSALEEEKSTLKNQIKTLDENIEKQKADRGQNSFLKNLETDQELADDICREFIEKITLLGHEENSRTAIIEIIWNI